MATNTSILGGDGILPVYGNSNHFVFADLMASGAANDSYVISPGGGYRMILNNQIWGAYLFADYQRPNPGGNFWDFSPGVEWISSRWDAHLNAYFPTTTNQAVGSKIFADQIGDNSQVSFSGHNQYDAYVAQTVGMGNGVDAEFAYSFPTYKNLRTRVYVGGYYYAAAPENTSTVNSFQSIRGVTAGIEVPVNKYLSFAVNNSYDNANHNVASISLNITLGGESNLYSKDVHDRLLDPIERHVGIIDTGAGAYAQKGYTYQGNGLEYDNIFFMSPDGTGNGTFGSPMPLTQLSLDTINSESPNNARIYLQGGDPPIYEVNTTSAPDTYIDIYTSTTYQGLLVHNGQDFYGRSADYTAAATSGEQPIISIDGASGVDGFIISSGENIFDDLMITASSTNGGTAGIVALSGSADTTVNVTDGSNITGLNIGLYAENGAANTLTVNTSNASFSGNTNSGVSNSGAFGVNAFNNSSGTLTINATDSYFNNNSSADGNGGAMGMSIINISSGTLNVNTDGSQFNENNYSAVSSTNIGAYGLRAMNTHGGTLNMNTVDSQFNDNIDAGPSLGASGLYVDSDSSNVNMSIMNSLFNGNTGSGGENGGAYGMQIVADNLDINIVDSFFDENTTSGITNGDAFGFYANVSNLTMSVTNSTFNDNANSGSGNFTVGALILAQTGTIDLVNSQFNGNTTTGVSNGGAYGFLLSGEGSGNLTMNIAGSQFNNNVASGDSNAGAYGVEIDNQINNLMTFTITTSQFNGNSASGSGNYGAYGFAGYNLPTADGGDFIISATSSVFNTNTASGGVGYGFYVENDSTGGGVGPLSVTSLAGSTIANNSSYGIYGVGNALASTAVNYTGVTFYGNPANVGSSGDVDFTN